MFAKRLNGPIRLVLCSVDEWPRGLDKVDEVFLETQPLALERVGLVPLGSDLSDQVEESAGLSHAKLYHIQVWAKVADCDLCLGHETGNFPLTDCS